MASESKKKELDLKNFLTHILKNLPSKPGVYRFKDKNNTVIYVGKAINLKNRVSSYFKKNTEISEKTRKLVSQIRDIDFTIVGSELEAVMLETNLIKELQPKYNILMKDDKNFVYLKITVNEDYPRIFITRKVDKDGALYFGPKTARFKLEKTLKILKKIFPYRHCQLDIIYENETNREIKMQSAGEKRPHHNVSVKRAVIKYPCIDYHIKRCAAPCIGLISPFEYREIIDRIIDFFKGKHELIIDMIKADMHRAAAEKKFELAASFRDKLAAIEDIMEKQNITAPDHRNLDVINYVCKEERSFFNLFQVREGKLINQENFELIAKNDESPDENEILTNFIQQYYEKTTDLPDEILIPHAIEQYKLFEQWLSGAKGKKIRFLVPERGRKDKLLELGHRNAANFAKLSEIKWEGHLKSARDGALAECARLLKLEKPPKRMECYDISHSGGTETVASMVVFENGFPKKEDYRKFRLHNNNPGSPDDYASMKECLSRRLKHLKPALATSHIKVLKPKKSEIPDLLKICGHDVPESNRLFKITIDKKISGHLEIFTDSAKRVLIENFSIKDNSLITVILKKTAALFKTKKIYLRVPETSARSFEEIGLQIINKIPDTFNPMNKTTIMLILLSKHDSDSSLSKKPDIIIVDGGKGQLNVAKLELKKLNLDIPLLSIAKQNEEIYLPSSLKPVIYPKDHPFLHLIQHLRDESHRFAVSYQQNLKLKSTPQSELDNIFGVGEQTKIKLLRHFGSVAAIKDATMYELEKIVGKKNAVKIKSSLL